MPLESLLQEEEIEIPRSNTSQIMRTGLERQAQSEGYSCREMEEMQYGWEMSECREGDQRWGKDPEGVSNQVMRELTGHSGNFGPSLMST